MGLGGYLGKFAGDRAVQPPRPPLVHVAYAWLGGCISLAALSYLALQSGSMLVLGSFGASCVLIYGFPDVPFSQPRNVVLGHVLSSLVGLSFFHLAGPHWWSLALATGTAIAVMLLTRTVHPPAGSNPVIVFLGHMGWSFLLFPTLAGVLILVAIALLYNNGYRATRYPKYWW